ncbi:AP-3 complex subunit beta-1-like isoform X1 [Centruroides sculpturatus]|uniref:AP-3 complex subunit beta-1-like isoform X1 n=1 Tax=Centruroides sculpturatus TaxID=218467 RepID=UPI000C6D7069|nr:AP-3 complex subunit beta-1-like isoform X1 [Centruroides sculpturatus]
MLDSNKDGLKLEAMKRIIGMIAKGKDASELFPAVVKNVVSKNIEVKKLVYVYLVRYAEEQQDLALLSISTFQRALKDPNQLIRASALRVLSSIRVPVIVPIMMLAIKDAVNDMSPYVRKTAAHAIPKLYSLDPEQRDQLIEVIEKLLSDKTTLVVGSAVMAFEEVCPEKIDLIHKNYRKLCNMLVDVEEWGQVVIINVLTRYAHTQFVDPNKYLKDGDEEDENKPFYDSDESENKEPKENKYIMDPDHRLLLRNCKPLLQSRNAAVVMAVAQLYCYLAPKNEVNIIAKALIRLIHSHREIQSVVLSNIATLSTKHKKQGMFEPYLKSFFVRPSDPTHIKLLKLEILTNLSTETNISIILREFQTYVSSSDMDFVAATIQAIGRCASSIKEVTDTCLNGLVSLLSNRNGTVVAESVVVIKKLLQMQPSEHKDIIIHMSKLMDSITVPMARASILWLLGEYADRVPKIAPDVLRKVTKSFIHEEDIVKLQTLNLASKLYLTNAKQTKLLTQYVFNLAKYDQNYDIRDRARFLRQLIMPQGEKPSYLSKCAKKILLASKPAPLLQSKFSERDIYQLGSLSHYIDARANGYCDLPKFPEVAPDPSLRNVDLPTPWQDIKIGKKKKPVIKKKSFYSETESSSSEEAAEGSASSESEAEESEDKVSGSSEEDSESQSESEEEESERNSSEEEESESGSGFRVKFSRDKVRPGSSKEEESEGAEESSSSEAEESTSSEDDDDEDEEEEDEEEEKAWNKKKSSEKKQQSDKKPSKDLLLLDLDDFNIPASTVPVMQPSAMTVLTPSAITILDKPLEKPIFTPIMIPPFVPVQKHELLNRYNGSGLIVTYRFTRSPNIYSSKMISVELTLTNESAEEIKDLYISDKKSSNVEVKGVTEIGSLPVGSMLTITIGIDYNETTQPAWFELKSKKRSHNLSIKAPIGETLQPVEISKADFLTQQNKLKGMNENTGCVTVLSDKNDPKSIINTIYETANVKEVYEKEEQSGVYRFAAQTLVSHSPVLITVQVLNDGKANITVNCEKMIIGSMLLKELKESLGK